MKVSSPKLDTVYKVGLRKKTFFMLLAEATPK